MSFFSDVQLQSVEAKQSYQPGLPDRAASSFLFTANNAWKTQNYSMAFVLQHPFIVAYELPANGQRNGYRYKADIKTTLFHSPHQ